MENIPAAPEKAKAASKVTEAAFAYNCTRLCDGGGLFLELELDLLVLADVDRHLAAVLQLAEQQLVGERTADRVLDQARHRPRTHQRVEALAREVQLELGGELRLDLLLGELLLELHQ